MLWGRGESEAATLIVDDAGIVRFADASASALLGRDPTELVGQEFGHPVTGAPASDVEIPVPGGKTVRCAMRVSEMTLDRRATFVVSLRAKKRRLRASVRSKESSSAEDIRFPAKFLLIVIVVSLTMIGHYSWNAWRDYQTVQRFGDRTLRIHDLQGKIVHLDEVLTMSARMAAATGDPKWEERYRHFDPLLVGAINEATALSAYRADQETASAAMEAANARLVEIEQKSFDLIREGRLADAQALLNGVEYSRLKKEYADGIERAHHVLQEDTVETLQEARQKLIRTFVFALALFLVWAASWVVLVGVLWRWRRRLSESNTKLQIQSRMLARLSDASQASLVSMIQQIPDGIAVLDERGIVLLMNGAAESFFGRKAEEMTGTDFGHPLTSKDGTEIQSVLPQGKRVFGDMKIRRLTWRGGLAFIAVIRDVTERKQMEAHLLQSQKLEMVGTFAGGVAHDLNNQLTPVKGYLDMIQQRMNKGDPFYEMIADAGVAATRCVDVVQRLVGFSRPSSRLKTILSLPVLLKELKTLLTKFLPVTVEVDIRCPDSVWPIAGNDTEIQTMLMNFASNARHAMPRGGRFSIEAKNVPLASSGLAEVAKADHVLITVSDTGKGIPPHVIGRIFEPFFTTKRKGEGTGLGLAMVFQIIASHQGAIDVSSREGEGTQFRIYLPASPSGYVAAPSVPEALSTGLFGTGETVLLVDDEEAVRKMGRIFLEGLGYRVLVARDGPEAVDIYREGHAKIAAVVLDMTMPKLTGRACLQALLAIDPAAKVIVNTGYTVEGTGEELKEAGAADFITKPYTVVALGRALQGVLRGATAFA